MIIGVDCGATFIKAGLVDKNQVSRTIKIKTNAQKGKNSSLQAILSAIEKLFNPIVKGIGIGFPAPIDVKEGLIREVNNMPGWKNVFLKKIVEEKFKIPCLIENDANCFTLAEFKYGSGKNKKNIVGITLGTGVGMGIIINKKLYSGTTGAAGEISRILYNNQWIENLANTIFFNKVAKMNPFEMHEKLKHNNKVAQKIITLYGKNIGIIMAVITDIIDPEIIIIGGGLSHLFPHFKKSMFLELKKHCYKETYKNLKIVQSKLKDAAIVGAASLFDKNG